jgi:hypothetical protein
MQSVRDYEYTSGKYGPEHRSGHVFAGYLSV